MTENVTPQLHVILADARRHIHEQYQPGRARSLALTKLDEAELWLTVAEQPGAIPS